MKKPIVRTIVGRYSFLVWFIVSCFQRSGKMIGLVFELTLEKFVAFVEFTMEEKYEEGKEIEYSFAELEKGGVEVIVWNKVKHGGEWESDASFRHSIVTEFKLTKFEEVSR